MKKTINIAIDGPSGAGKSSMARRIAAELGFLYVDTGALYRAVGLYVYRKGLDGLDVKAVEALLPEIELALSHEGGVQQVWLCGENVSDEIRLPAISEHASRVSAYPVVRAFLLDTQRRLAAEHDVIMDGRDIGTVILPAAQVKIFLHADVEDRARRRYEELIARGTPQSYEEVLSAMRLRDERDSVQTRMAPDAIDVNTTGNSFEQTLELLTNLIRERLDHVV
ncbi:MAG: (d)CMP kinase [Clostridia bacterium]|nr:(d)CMP kinase [Oscillospiraceae bacterium]MBR6747529.1 (d)CMP kinase [Clostridia bacterium]